MLCLSPEIKALWRQLRKWTSDHNWEFLIIPKLQKLTKTKFNLLLNLKLNFEKTRIYLYSKRTTSPHPPTYQLSHWRGGTVICIIAQFNLSFLVTLCKQSIATRNQLLFSQSKCTFARGHPATSVFSREKIDIYIYFLVRGRGFSSLSHTHKFSTKWWNVHLSVARTRTGFGRYQLKICNDINVYLNTAKFRRHLQSRDNKWCCKSMTPPLPGSCHDLGQ